MAHFERIRDVISGPFSPEVIRQRMAAGWQLVSIEWRRELPESEAPTQGAFSEAIPYGLRISDDCQRLEVDPVEDRTLMLMMELLVQDFPYSSIVSDLNEKGLRMRDGRPWTRVAVFNMTPRLIEVGPRIFSTEETMRLAHPPAITLDNRHDRNFAPFVRQLDERKAQTCAIEIFRFSDNYRSNRADSALGRPALVGPYVHQ
jgi:hypothetical protein